MIKVTAHYKYEHHHENVELEFKEKLTLKEIEEAVDADFEIWVTNYTDSGGWHIESIEKVEQ